MRLRLVPLLSVLPLLLSCAEGGGDSGSAPPGDGFQGPACAAGEVICDGAVAKVCDGRGGFDSALDCSSQSQKCAPGYGCVDCIPYAEGACAGGVATMCAPSGSGSVTFECDPEQGMTCDPDGCHGTCSPMSLQGSYIGCEYWPTVSWNGTLSKWFHFAAAIANASTEFAQVKITRGSEVVASVDIAPGSLEIVRLPWVPELKGEDSGGGVLIALPVKSVIAPGGAYRLRSNQPVSVYQFNALEYQNIEAPASTSCQDMQLCCPDHTNTGECFSYSNDASLLLPTNVLGDNYAVLGYRGTRSGLAVMFDAVAVTAVEDGTNIHILPSTPTAPGGTLPALAPGQTGHLTLQRGDVLQLLNVGTSLSGSRIWSDDGKPFQLIGLMPAAEITEGVHAADHIEEIILPAGALGRDYVVTVPTTPLGKRIHTVRIQPVADDTHVTFDPPGVHEPVDLDAWETLEIGGVDVDVRVVANQPVGITQYMHGEGLGPQQEGAAGAGDPSQSLVVPTQQFRNNYIFLAPADYDTSWVNVTAPAGARVILDGAEIPQGAYEAVGDSGMAATRHQLDDRQYHRIESDVPFGIAVYGYGRFTSYMYPGGLDVRIISNVPPPK